jgi:hypothetical protein
MTISPQPKSLPIPALLVYGKPTSPDLPQASWFPVEDRPTVEAAAQSLKFSVLDIRSEAEKALMLGVHEGVLKGNSRMIVGSVSSEVYKRIEEFAANKNSLPSATKESSKTEGGAKSTIEQNTNTVEASSSRATPPQVAAGKPSGETISGPNATRAGGPEITNATPPNPWDTLRIGARVLAAHWNENHEFEGFWLATVKRIEKGEFTLEWFEAPEYPTFKSRPKNIAVPHPEFRITGK